MMPSRGLQLARGHAPRLYQLQCRNLSSHSRRMPRARLPQTYRSLLQSTQWQKSIPLPPAALIGIRHASSTPQEIANPAPPLSSPPQEAAAASASVPTTPPPTTTPTDPFPNLDTIFLSPTDIPTPLDSIPEQIGYLHSLGLTYGYGPTSLLEWLIEHLHILGGLPWWASIASTAVLLRLVMFPLYIKSSDVSARQTALVSITKPVTERMQAAKRAGDQQAMMAAWAELLATRKRAGVNFRSQFAPALVQGVFAYCGFKLIRAMVALPVPALQTEGPLWLHDLTLTDPYLILPFAMAGCVHLLVRLGGESGAQASSALSPGMQKFMLYGMPGLIVIGMGYQSAALCVWFAAGGAMGIGQSLVLRRPGVRAWLGIAPLYKPSKEEMDTGLTGMLMDFGKKPDASASTRTRRPSATAAAAGGKNAAFMNPVYQSPSLTRSKSKGSFRKKGEVVIDVEPVVKPSRGPLASDPEMVQASQPPREGVLGKVGSSWKELKRKWTERKKVTAEQIEERKREAFRREAENYEKRAQKRRGGGGG